MNLFDPNAPLPSFEDQARNVSRQRQLAELLRQQATAPVAQGQMVSGHYVAPSPLAALVPALAGLGAYYKGKSADKAEGDYGQAVQSAQNQWASTLPRAVAGVEGRPELPGPREASGSPELDAVEAVPASRPSREAILKATIAGMRIPGNSKAAELWNKGMASDVEREDKQTEAKAARDAQLAQAKELEANRLAERAESAERRSQDARLATEQRAAAAAESAAARREHTAVMLEIAKMRAAVSGSNGVAAPKPLPAAQAKAWTENNKSMNFIDDALKAVDEYPQGLSVTNVLGNTIRSRTDPKGVDVRALVGNIGSLKVHDRSGAAVTAAETPRLTPFIPQPTDNAATVKKKLHLFKREYQLMQQEIVDLANTQGYKNPAKKAAPSGKWTIEVE